MPSETMSRVVEAHELRVGLSAEYEREVTKDDVLCFAKNSGDSNPLHVDANYARQTTFKENIVHGAFQVGLASALVGMQLPGRNALVATFSAQFPTPLRVPRHVRVRGEITAWNLEANSGRVQITVTEIESGNVTAKIASTFSLHEASRPDDRQGARADAARPAKDLETVIVTGASGGIGSELVRSLANRFQVVAIGNRNAVPRHVADQPHVRSLSLDLAKPEWPVLLADAMRTDRLYAIIHCAWPGMPRGGLLEIPSDAIQAQLAYGSVQLVELAKLLASNRSQSGGRLIAIGSILGTQRPLVTTAAYSLGKATLEHTVRLLAAELALKQITVNAVCPGFIPLGINKAADDRRKMIECAQVPMGRLCQAEDVCSTIEWLLSKEASFVSGQMIGLNGGQL